MDDVDNYKRTSRPSGNRPPLTGQARMRAIARRKRRRRQRRIILGTGIVLLLAIILAAWFGISSYRTQKKQQALFAQGTEYLDQGKYDEAIEIFNEFLAISKEKNGKQEQLVLLYRAETEYSKEDYRAALATCEELIATDGENDDYRKLQSLCQLKLGDYEAALTYAPNAAIIYNRMAKKAIDERRYEDALAAVTKGMATADAAAMADLALNQAIAYEKSGDYARALELFEAYIETYGPDPTAEKEIIFLRSRQGNNNMSAQ